MIQSDRRLSRLTKNLSPSISTRSNADPLLPSPGRTSTREDTRARSSSTAFSATRRILRSLRVKAPALVLGRAGGSGAVDRGQRRPRSTIRHGTQLTVIVWVTIGPAPCPGNADPVPLNITSVTVKVPVLAYRCVGLAPDPVDPSPNSHM